MFSFDHRHVEDGFVQRFVVAREHSPGMGRLQVRDGQPPVLHCTLRTTKAWVLFRHETVRGRVSAEEPEAVNLQPVFARVVLVSRPVPLGY